MKISFSKDAWEEYSYWQRNNAITLRKINQLIKEIQRHPTEGRGKPELLKHELTGLWSRRIDPEHRLVYQVTDNEIIIHSCRFHY